MGVRTFYEPDVVDANTDAHIQDKADKAVSETDSAVDTGKSNTGDLYDEQKATKDTDLYKYQNANIAKTGGQQGNLTGKDFSKTLRLAREVDAYNAAPREDTFFIGPKGQIQNLGKGYDKPELHTQDQKAMEQAWNLDTQRKLAAQNLQEIIDRKDYDAYIQYMNQKYGLELTRTQAEIQMRQQTRMAEIGNIISKDMAGWSARFTRAFTDGTISMIMNAVRNGNQQYANYLSTALIGLPAVDMLNLLSEDTFKESFNRQIAAGVPRETAWGNAMSEAASNASNAEQMFLGAVKETGDFSNRHASETPGKRTANEIRDEQKAQNKKKKQEKKEQQKKEKQESKK